MTRTAAELESLLAIGEADNAALTAERKLVIIELGLEYDIDDDRPLDSLVSEALGQKDNELAEKDAEIEELKKQLVAADDFMDELESIWGEQSRYLRRDHSLEGLRTLRKQLAEATKPEGK